MEIRGKIQAPAALPPVPTELAARLLEIKILVSAGSRTPWTYSPNPGHCAGSQAQRQERREGKQRRKYDRKIDVIRMDAK